MRSRATLGHRPTDSCFREGGGGSGARAPDSWASQCQPGKQLRVRTHANMCRSVIVMTMRTHACKRTGLRQHRNTSTRGRIANDVSRSTVRFITRHVRNAFFFFSSTFSRAAVFSHSSANWSTLLLISTSNSAALFAWRWPLTASTSSDSRHRRTNNGLSP